MKVKTNFYQDVKKRKKIVMQREGKNVHNAKGDVVSYAKYSNPTTEKPVVRVNQNRKWFSNTRTIGQEELQSFREELKKTTLEPYKVLVQQKKLPLSLLKEPKSRPVASLTATEPFAGVFGPKALRKKPSIRSVSLKDYANEISNLKEPIKKELVPFLDKPAAVDPIFQKGKSKRIWGEYFKVLDSSDIILHVLDCRNPIGTYCKTIKEYIENEAKQKTLVIVLNKSDLVPKTVVEKWQKYFSKKSPTVVYQADINSSFGKRTLISILRQLSNIHKTKNQINVGFVGYPNVGKSSVINSLRSKKVCVAAPIPGQTRVWQYVSLTKRINLIDCPGIVPTNQETETDKVLKGVVRITNLPEPEDHIKAVLDLVNREHVRNLYKIDSWNDSEDFLTKLAIRSGKLHKGGIPDISTVARKILTDWLGGRLPFYIIPEEYKSMINAPALDGARSETRLCDSKKEE
eukprot:GHVP01038163.1.p1 GENE.GHVP01038163.1~~GHVP01038163.1.p1  ORF type:complete len:460 (-),score=94.72 GHVP01038163.1:969-2348(-)